MENPEPDVAPHLSRPTAVVAGPGYRITVLTSRLLRLEHQPDGMFTDGPTQLVQHRSFPPVAFTVAHTDGGLDLWTDDLHLRYDKKPFSPAGLSVTMRHRSQDSHHTTWHYGDPVREPRGPQANLGGTARTLDNVDGVVDLEPGLLSKYGYAVVDDSRSLVVEDDGWVAQRPAPEEDLYFFGYARDYTAALRDYFTLTGPSPLLPRWTLGNWWSRFHRYTARDYLALMDHFRAANIPFSVAVVDMDWHVVDIDPAQGTGWTGYTWNPELFPDPADFLRQLHDRDLRVTLNVHPADGVRSHEAAYGAMARDLGFDASSGLGIAFDITSREFVAAYLHHLHHPHEEIGVDFWWLDWQSGSNARVPGLDPLWMLNHVHYRDSARDGKRPLTFSRYAGLGSHRYPVGFSGDTIVSWESLDFQPYFTATAANVGYFWWSHDIGGHLGGVKDNELATRWCQLGVFSPINRLHSSNSRFNSKEPWRFGTEAQGVMTDFLRARHRLVPYLYTAMWFAHVDGQAPVQPMYHRYPSEAPAYEVPNQYMFGSHLLVAPITTPADPRTHHAQVTVWLPEGTWFDAFNGRRYCGGRILTVHRPLESMPVFAPAGAIVPLAVDPLADVGAAPAALVLRVFPGARGAFTLIEDDGAVAPERQETIFSLEWSPHANDSSRADAVLRVAPPTGSGVLTRRTLAVELPGVQSVGGAVLRTGEGGQRAVAVDSAALRPGVNGEEVAAAAPSDGVVRVDLGEVDLFAGVELHLADVALCAVDARDHIFAVLDRAEISFDLKTTIMGLADDLGDLALLAALHTLELPGNLHGVLVEAVTAAAPHR